MKISAGVAFYALPAVVRSITLAFFVLMPVMYAEKLIKAQEMGMIGALTIALVIVGALTVARSLHTLTTRRLLMLGGALALVAATLLVAGTISKNLALIVSAYGCMGIMAGMSMSGANAVAANFTTRGDRFGRLAKQSMVVDVVRITAPLAVAGLVVLWGIEGGALLAAFSAILLCVLAWSLPPMPQTAAIKREKNGRWSLLKNKRFRFTLSLELLDSFASSELFVFLPLVLLAKGYDIGSSLLLQSFLFLGYLTGRWLVGWLAKRYSGFKAVGLAEIGMVVSIVLLLSIDPLWLVYFFSFMLGIFARGTSPAIKALAFDSVDDHHTKQASAVYVVAGDTGSSLGQLSFGFLVAWLGANAPFILAAIIAGLVAVLCLLRPLLAKQRPAIRS